MIARKLIGDLAKRERGAGSPVHMTALIGSFGCELQLALMERG